MLRLYVTGLTYADYVHQGFGQLTVATALTLAIIALTMAEVVSRYVLRNPLILSDEFGGYALVAISFLGLAYCAQAEAHIAKARMLLRRALEP